MTFALSGLWIAAGLAGLAAALYLLQRLRVRHREVPVVTTMFWKQAVEETRARVLVQRFRHLPAYLFLLAIASLLWFGFADPRAEGGAGAPTVLLLDASAGMAEGERFAEAKEALLDEARGLAAGRRHVLYCGGHVRTLLAPGESVLLLARRLEGLQPEDAPASLARVARAVRRAHPDAVLRVHGEPAEVPTPAALGIAPAASGAWDKVDLLALPAPRETGGDDGWPALDGARLGAQVNSFDGGSERTGLWQDLPADGGTVTITYGGRAHALALPTRKPIRVSVDADLLPVLGPLLDADPGIERVADEADVAIGRGDVAVDGSVPSLDFVRGADATIVLRLEDAAAQDGLERVARELALAEIDGAALAEALDRPVTVLGEEPASDNRPMHAPGHRAVLVDQALLDPEVGFVHTRAFALLVAGAIRRLADVEPVVPYVAAGEALPAASGAYGTPDGTSEDPLGAPFTPAVVGDYARGDARLYASLQPDPAAAPFRGDGADAAASSGAWPLVRWLGLLVFVLLALEWWLCRKGRIP